MQGGTIQQVDKIDKVDKVDKVEPNTHSSKKKKGQCITNHSIAPC